MNLSSLISTHFAFSCDFTVSSFCMTTFPTNCFLNREKINYANNLLPTMKREGKKRRRSKREEFVKLSSYVLDKIFLSNLCCNGIRMVVDILHFDIRVRECTFDKILQKIRACSGIRSVARRNKWSVIPSYWRVKSFFLFFTLQYPCCGSQPRLQSGTSHKSPCHPAVFSYANNWVIIKKILTKQALQVAIFIAFVMRILILRNLTSLYSWQDKKKGKLRRMKNNGLIKPHTKIIICSTHNSTHSSINWIEL